MPHLVVDRFRQVTIAGNVLDENNFAGAYYPGFPVAGGQLDAGIEVDDVLPARCWVPGAIMFGPGLAEDDAVCLFQDRCFAFRPFLRPIDRDVPPVRLAGGVAIQIVDMDPH